MASESLVFFFSGVGNSRSVAFSIAARLQLAVARPLLAEAGRAEALAGASRVGLVFPVHFMQAPRAVLEALRGLDLAGKKVFAVATSGGEAGDALGQVRDVVVVRGAVFVAGLHLPMTDTSVVLSTKPEEKARNLAALGPRLDGFVAVLSQGAKPLPARHPAWWRVAGGLTRAGMLLVYRYDRKTVDAKACVGCGHCVSACPVGNIVMDQGKARMGSACADCFGCIHACPTLAISFGRIHMESGKRFLPPLPA